MVSHFRPEYGKVTNLELICCYFWPNEKDGVMNNFQHVFFLILFKAYFAVLSKILKLLAKIIKNYMIMFRA